MLRTVPAACIEAASMSSRQLIWRKPGAARAVLDARRGQSAVRRERRVPCRTSKEHAMDEATKTRLKRLLETIRQGVVQEVPPELYACEICRRTECFQDEWIVCENRIAHARCLAEHEDAARS
jgi:hypothetical protein